MDGERTQDKAAKAAGIERKRQEAIAKGIEMMTGPVREEFEKLAAEFQTWQESAAKLFHSAEMQKALKQLNEIMPYSRMVSEAFPNGDPLWNYPLHIFLFPIQAYIENNDLRDADADTIEAHRGPFLAFYKAYVDECRAVERANPAALKSIGVCRQIMKALAGKGFVQADAAQQQPSAEAMTALTIAGYSYLKQGPITNSLAKINTKATDSINLNPITGAATAKNGDLSILIEHFDELTRGLETSTHQLFDFLIRQFTHSGGQSPLIQIPLKEYMDKRGLKDEKEARRQVNADLETLRNIKLTFTDKKAGYVDTYLFGGEKGIKNSVIYFSLSRTFYAILKGYPVMPMPDALYKIDSRYYRHAYSMGRALLTHKRMNAGKGNENRIAVKTLLTACPLLPKYESLDKSRGEISRKIIEPFEQNLNHLEDLGVLTWGYCHSGGGPMTAEEEERAERGMPYDLFSDLLIQFDMKDYPDQAKLLGGKSRRKKQSEKAERKTRSPRKPAATTL